MAEYKFKTEGDNFRKLIESKGYSTYSFARATNYSMSRMYRLVTGEDDLRTLVVKSIIVFIDVLKIDTVDEFYKLVGIDLHTK